MRLVFFGASTFGLRCLATAAAIPECQVVGILTAPERFAISYRPEGVRNVLHADFSGLADQCGADLHVLAGKMTDPALVALIRRWRPDFILVAGWYHMVPREIREIAPTAGLHASLLPDYSGGAPLVWAIINGEQKAGITFFLFDQGVDNGPIIDQKEQPIHFDDTIATLLERIQENAVQMIREHLPNIQQSIARARPQDESKRRIMPQRAPQDGLIDWAQPARRIYDFVRAQTRPYPGAFTYLRGRKLTIWRAAVSDARRPRVAPGGVQLNPVGGDGAFGVWCGDGRLLLIQEVGKPDGAALNGGSFVRDEAVRGDTVLGEGGESHRGRTNE